MSQTIPGSTSQRGSVSVWAFIFIAVGVIWLLRAANIINGQHLAVLFRLWPLLLIAIGVQLLLGQRNRRLAQSVVGVTIVILIGLMFIGPSIGLAGDIEVKTMTVSEPLGAAQSAQVNVGLDTGRGSVYALGDSGELIAADLRYIGDVQFDVQDGEAAIVNLKQEGDADEGLELFGFTMGVQQDELHWDVGLSPAIPMQLSVSSGVGAATLDLSGLQLTKFSLSTGVGESYVTLPVILELLPIDISGGIGKTTLIIPDGTIVHGEIHGGIGETQIDISDNAAVRIEASSGVGNLNFPSSWRRVSGENNNGVWESPTYQDAADAQRIEIDYSGGIGTLNVY